MKIIWLHKLGNPRFRRESVASLEYALKRLSGEHEILIWDVEAGSPTWLSSEPWDAIFLGPTFLWHRQGKSSEALRQVFAWVEEARAYKIALPQDEYFATEKLEQWLLDWGVAALVSIFPDHQNILYPRLTSAGVRVEKGYTGIISEELREASRTATAVNRLIDVSYRAAGSRRDSDELYRFKSDVGQKFLSNVKERKARLRTDISTDSRDTIFGPDWFDFVKSSRFVLATPSGSSFLDRTGELMQSHSKTFLHASSTQLPATVQPIAFETMSPRHFEAALLETGQVCLSGDYGGLIVPGVNAIELHRDFSNIDAVIDGIGDERRRIELVRLAKESILSEKRLFLDGYVDFLLDLLEISPARRDSSTAPGLKASQRNLYHQGEMASARAWRFAGPRAHLSRSLRSLKVAIKKLTSR